MDSRLQLKVNNIINELENQINKDYIDTPIAKNLMQFAINRISLLLLHIGYLETKLESTIEFNKMLAEHTENLIAENQRLSQIAKY